MYVPKLIPLQANSELLLAQLLETLARNVHDSWAARMISEGWKFASVRDDDAKQHPCLVPFEDLSEVDRESDRSTVRSVVATLVALGYRIVPADDASPPLRRRDGP